MNVPRLSRTAKRLLAAVDATTLAPDQGWGWYLPDAIGAGWTAKLRLLDVGYVREGAAGEQPLVLTDAGAERLASTPTTATVKELSC